MSAKDDAIVITEYAVAKLEIGPGDVLLVKPSGDWTPEQRHYLADVLAEWGQGQGLNFCVLVAPPDCEFSVAKDATS